MANGRMITKDIAGDKRINQLSSDTSRLAFTWLITFCDREGRTHGDPAMVRSLLFPRRQDVSIEDMEEIIKEWAALGLIVWYEIDDDLWIWFPSFDKNQPGLRKDKEAPSKIPSPTNEGTELVRSRYGLGTDKIPVKLIEGNGNKVKEKGMEGDNGDAPDLFEEYQRIINGQGIMLTGEADIKSLREIIDMGASREDLTAGIAWKADNNQGKAIRWVSQIVGPTKTAMQKRLQSSNGHTGENFKVGEGGRVLL